MGLREKRDDPRETAGLKQQYQGEHVKERSKTVILQVAVSDVDHEKCSTVCCLSVPTVTEYLDTMTQEAV